jgi:hypothetical protein
MLRITEELAASYAEANNIYTNFPEAISLPTVAGGWVWVAIQYPQVAEDYRTGHLTGLEPAPAGVILRVMPPTPPEPTPSVTRTPTPTSTVPDQPINDGDFGDGDNVGIGDGDSTFDDTTYTIGSGRQISSQYNSDILYRYIVEEIRAELNAEFGRDAYYDKTVDRIARALSRAIKKYLIVDVRAIDIPLQTNDTQLTVSVTGGGGYIIPDPHDHSIDPHGHDILAP